MSFGFVYSGTTGDCEIVKNHLVSNGIQASLCERSFDAFAPIHEYGTGHMPVMVIVPRDQEESAVALIKIFLKRDEIESWVCRGCGEEVQGQFTGCWKCGEVRG